MADAYYLIEHEGEVEADLHSGIELEFRQLPMALGFAEGMIEQSDEGESYAIVEVNGKGRREIRRWDWENDTWEVLHG